MKIHIIGGSGTGKSYISEKLSCKFNIPHFDLDNIFWDNTAETYGTKMPVGERTEMLNDILKNNHWIIEGVSLVWTNDYQSNKIPKIVAFLEPYKDKIIFVDKTKKIFNYIDDIV
jgi:adenylate kinase family enzyme